MAMSVEIVNGTRSGPTLFVCAAIHGDELNGIEIVRRVLDKANPQYLRGALVAVPVVNVYGLINHSRYLPDRRDLNRSFPGSMKGSLAARMARLFMDEIVSRATHGIDLHTASTDRTNLPQIRADLKNKETLRLAKAFGAPIMLNATIRDGSLREAASNLGIPLLVFEGGEPNRFNEDVVVMGVSGVIRVMQSLNMLRRTRAIRKPASVEVRETHWVRAQQSGFLHLGVRLGERVEHRQELGVICGAVGEGLRPIRAPVQGLVIAHAKSPLVHRGDAVVHIARYSSA
jgi:hypothetical protein